MVDSCQGLDASSAMLIGTGIGEGSELTFALAVGLVVETESMAAGTATIPCAQPVWRSVNLCSDRLGKCNVKHENSESVL